MTEPSAAERARPLRGLRVLTLVDGRLPSLGKTLADLGAEVEVLGSGAPEAVAGRPFLALTETAGKRFVALDPADPGADLERRLADADVVLCGPLAAGRTVAELADRYPSLIIGVVTDFGLTGPRRDWIGTNAVFTALSGVLARSGEPGHRPLLPPGDVFVRGAAEQIVWALLVAVATDDPAYPRVLDCAVFDCGAVTLDPAFGMTGSGTPDSLPGGDRPDAGHVYPIFTTRDGFVRVCVLARVQWESMRSWLGEPAELAGEEFTTNVGRAARADQVLPAMARLFAPMSSAELVAQCRQRGIPASAVLGLGDVLTEDHYREVGVLATVGRHEGRDVVAAQGMVRINGVRTAAHPAAAPAPPLVAHRTARSRHGAAAGPLGDLTVLDLGVIVAGAQASAVFAEQGARVIRIENRRFPDGMRRSFETLTPALARGHLGKQNVGLDLRSPEGREIFLELARGADVVMSNYKPGTVERLGIAYADLCAVNPRIVCVESSAYGDQGPWRSGMGYGPLVRAASGVTWLWREGDDATYFGDNITIYPDHVVARVCASTALAVLLDRRRTGVGGHVTVAQTDVALVQFAELLAAESVSAGSVRPPGRLGPQLLAEPVVRAAGPDEWCVVDPQTPQQLARLAAVLGTGDETRIEDDLQPWVAARSAPDAAERLQEAGVPAAPMARPHELVDDAQRRARHAYFRTPVAGTDEIVDVERYPVLSPDGSPLAAPAAPAPSFGRHTRAVLAELGRDDLQIARLLADGVAQESDAVTAVHRAAAGEHPTQ